MDVSGRMLSDNFEFIRNPWQGPEPLLHSHLLYTRE
jgi:hypothetical protein